VAQVPLELYTDNQVIIGTLEVGRRRLSDHLNDTTIEVLPLDDVWVGMLDRPEAPILHLSPVNLRKRELIVAVGQDRLDPPALRSGWVKTAQTRVAVAAGPYLVFGWLHLPQSARFEVRRLFDPGSRGFVPFTDAEMIYMPNPHVDSRHPVLVVRTDQVKFAGLFAEEAAGSMLAAAMELRMRTLLRGAKPTEQSREQLQPR